MGIVRTPELEKVFLFSSRSEVPRFIPMSEIPTIQTEVQVMFFDTDCAAVVHNIAYLRFIETARTYLAEQLGMGLSDMARTNQFPVWFARRSITNVRLSSATDS